MSATNLPFIQQQMIQYGMSAYFVLGIFGDACNCIMFTRRSYRHTPSSIYFLALSIIAIIYLMWLVPSALYTLNNIDPQKYSLFYCKIKTYIGHILGLENRYSMVFACADRFFATQTDARIRLLSSVRTARKAVSIIILVLILVAIHMPILMDIRGGNCETFGLYKLIYACYQVTLFGIIPPTLMSIFSILAIRNVHQRHGIGIRINRRDRYLLRMVIAEVIVIIFTSFLYVAYLFYSAVTYNVVIKSAERIEIEGFISFFSQFIIYLYNVIPFYLFMLTSKPFRKEFISLFVKCWYKYILRRVQVTPINEQNDITTMHGQTIFDRR